MRSGLQPFFYLALLKDFGSFASSQILVLRFGGNLKCNFGKMDFYSRINFINDFLNIIYFYIVYFLLVLSRKSKFRVFFPFTSRKVFKLCDPSHYATAMPLLSVPRIPK